MLAGVLLIAGCGSAPPSPTALLLEHVHVNLSDYEAAGYATAVCADLDEIPAPNVHNLAAEALTILHHTSLTTDEAMALSNGAVTYVCPKYRALHLAQ